MLRRRVIVVSADPRIRQQLLSLVTPTEETATAYADLDSLGPDGAAASVLLLHLEGEAAAVRLHEKASTIPGTFPLIAVVPGATIPTVVTLMSSVPRVTAAVIADDILTAAIVADDISGSAAMPVLDSVLGTTVAGLARVLPTEPDLQTASVGNHEEKTRCMLAISQFVEQLGATRGRREAIVQCVDELLTNALYSAPVDARGRRIFANVSPQARIRFRTDQSVRVQYAYVAGKLAISVCDAFGSVTRATLLRHLYKGTHADDQVDKKVSGAGLGLYLIANAASALYFHVIPGVMTDVVCVFDILQARQNKLGELSFVVGDPAGHALTPPARRRHAGSRLIHNTVAGVLVCAVVATGIVAWRHLFPPPTASRTSFSTTPAGAELEVDGRPVGPAPATVTLQIGQSHTVIARLDGHAPTRSVVRVAHETDSVALVLQPSAVVEIDTRPSGAQVKVGGKPMGTTPLRLISLDPGATASVSFTHPGYEAASATVTAPKRSEVVRHVQELRLSDRLVRVHLVSNPAGAAIVRKGQPLGADRTYTPADVFVEAEQSHELELVMPKHVPLVVGPFTPPRGSAPLELGGTLVPIATSDDK